MQSYSLITSLVTGFGLALPFGYVAERFLKSPALVGYILAGVAVSVIPGLPPVDSAMIEQLAEIGVMLLMFGVGLHFSVKDLLSVKGLVVPGALLQMCIAALIGALVAKEFWGWNFGAAVLFGFTISCASTVVVTKALEIRRMTSDPSGRAAIGWLVVEDLASVVLLVCLPPFAQAVHGASVSTEAVLFDVVKTLGWAALFVVLMLFVGRKIMPQLLRQVALTGSRELFTLTVLGCAIVIAYGAGAIFEVSFALGAFFAGMVMQESRYAHRAATDSLPLQDAFSVLFFVSVGMMLDWHVFLSQPWEVFAVVFIIIFGKMLISVGLVLLLRWPLATAFTIGACLGQIGEFSYILATQGILLKLVDSSMMSLIVAASIVTIAFNPVLFVISQKAFSWSSTHWKWAKRAAARPLPAMQAASSGLRERLNGHVIVAGASREGGAPFFDALKKASCQTIVIAAADVDVESIKADGFKVLTGDPADAALLTQAQIKSAGALVVPAAQAAQAKKILEVVRSLNAALPVVVLLKNTDEIELFDQSDKNLKLLCEPLIAELTAAAATIEELLRKEEGEEDSARASVVELIDEEYRKSVALNASSNTAPEPGEPGTTKSSESNSSDIHAAAAKVADEAVSAARSEASPAPSVRDAAKALGRRFAGLFGRKNSPK